jgi:hypothetical protein
MAARLALLVGLTALSYPVGLLLGQPWLLPALNTLPAYLAMVSRLRAGERPGAVVTVLVWAASLALFGTLSFALWPARVDATVLNGPAYRDEIFTWICTGLGREGDPRLFLPQHALHLAGFVVLSLVTASALSILMGAVLMNYMAFYVASLARAGAPLASVVLLGWQPWALARIAAFCVLGAVLAEPLLCRVQGRRYEGLRAARPWLLLAAGGILADVLLKALLAPTWGRLLRGVLCA